MLEQAVERLYLKFRFFHCTRLLPSVQEEGLSAAESISLEVIYLLGRPTIKEFAEHINLSQPNATYRVNNLVAKGYVRKMPSLQDKREYHLEVTEKFTDHYGLNASYIRNMLRNIQDHFTPEEIDQLEQFVNRVVDEMME
ncbi:MAG: MarR family winged helix-turn-helix transcriptional regulator [Bacillota bacterium]